MKQSEMEKLLEKASKQLGVPPEKLKELITKGDMNAIMALMKGGDAEKLKNAMKDPKVSDALKSSPEMAEFMKNMDNK